MRVRRGVVREIKSGKFHLGKGRLKLEEWKRFDWMRESLKRE
jgi:hypothetical protein